MIRTTKSAKSEGGTWNKKLEPGNHKVKIVGVKYNPVNIKGYENAVNLIYVLESEPVGGDFQGFQIDKDDPSKGDHEGRVSWVKANPFPFYTGRTKNGKPRDTVSSVLASIKGMCLSLGCMDWWKSVDGKYETVEDFVKAFNDDAPYEDKWLYVCIQGTQYKKRDSNYLEWDLSFPYGIDGRYPYSSADGDLSKVVEFDSDVHAIKLPSQETNDNSDSDSGSDFDIDL